MDTVEREKFDGSYKFGWVVLILWLISLQSIFWMDYFSMIPVGWAIHVKPMRLMFAKLYIIMPALIFTIFLADVLTPGRWLERIYDGGPKELSKIVIAIIIAAAYCVR